MGKGDNRHTRKMKRKKAQKRHKDKLKSLIKESNATGSTAAAASKKKKKS